MPFFDCWDVIRSPSTAKLNSLIEKVHSKFVKILPFTHYQKISFKHERFRTAIQIFESYIRFLLRINIYNIFQVSKDTMGHVSHNINQFLSVGYLPIKLSLR